MESEEITDHDATKPVPTQYISNVAAGHDDRLEAFNAAAARHDDLEANMVVPAERVDVQVHATEVADKIKQTSIVPEVEVGMAFESEDNAYEMYNTYAGITGFSIRKSTTKHRPDGTLYLQKFLVCSSEGLGNASKGTTRTGCGARVQFTISKEGIWMVQKVVLEHNHYLASPNKKKNLRSQRHVTEAGMRPSQVFEFMKQFYGGADKVPFGRMDCNNKISRERKKYLESNDAQTLCNYLKNKQLEDPTFFLCS
ncbi:hypothetical protein GQ55_8G201000 [Panicum hallii var. hallii]|uniref:FAR1 domain-containing protein n=1 Tax=Panicum hallii var. hallii TaxID=1504633 RepID=A0A2T7CPC6_9POAL|nr:hypothetical protein GQ55_8G201000 [Panicum hallii var. hallii]